MTNWLADVLDEICPALDKCGAHEHAVRGFRAPANPWRWKDGPKWIKLDWGSSGHFLIEKATGEIYNIKSYGVPDHNKKKKADLGNIRNASADELFAKRYNYLR